jgi:predicted peptidase
MQRIELITTIVMISIASGLSDEPTPGKQVEQEFKTGDKTIRYLLYLPNDYATHESNLPILLFLHGRGESDGPLSLVKKWGPPRLIERGESFHYLVVSPQCPRSPVSWANADQQSLLLALLEHIIQTCKADPDRIYLTGLSMGGYGSWRLAADHPERFAAVVPICGGGKPEDAPKLKSLPIWVWHGAADTTVPPKRSVEMVEAIKQAGGNNIQFTTLEGIGHNSWEAAYASPDLYRWLDKQSASKNRERAAE